MPERRLFHTPGPPRHRAGFPHPRRRRVPPSLWLGGALTVAFALLALVGPTLLGGDPFVATAAPFTPPSAGVPFGSDDLGRDVWTGVVHGASLSLTVGLTVALASLLLGLITGGVAGYAGGWLDDVLMRAAEVVQVLPRFFLALTVVALFGASLVNLTLVLALTSWTVVARVVRASVLAVKEEVHVDAARALGGSDLRILVRHVLPLALGPAVAYAALQVGNAMLVEAGLSFLGFGDPTRVSWGYLLNVAQPYVHRAWWLSAFPGAALALAVLGVNLLADGLRGMQPTHGVGH